MWCVTYVPLDITPPETSEHEATSAGQSELSAAMKALGYSGMEAVGGIFAFQHKGTLPLQLPGQLVKETFHWLWHDMVPDDKFSTVNVQMRVGAEGLSAFRLKQ